MLSGLLKWLDPVERTRVDLKRRVDKHGWTAVSPKADRGRPNYCYTIGFARTLDCPDFVISGMPDELTNSVLWEIFCLVKQGREARESQTWQMPIKGLCLVSRAVHPTNNSPEHFAASHWFWREQGREGLPSIHQLVWPYGNGLYPWDADCPEVARAGQSPLYRPAGEPHA